MASELRAPKGRVAAKERNRPGLLHRLNTAANVRKSTVANLQAKFVVPDFDMLGAKLLSKRPNEVSLIFARVADEGVVQHGKSIGARRPEGQATEVRVPGCDLGVHWRLVGLPTQVTPYGTSPPTTSVS